jgi:hypothetical protein
MGAFANNSVRSMYKGSRLFIATKHEKERVMSPILERELGVQCFISSGFDTDILGTFSGEIERKDTPMETARKKCLLGIEKTGADLVIANEGSFGPHPNVPFLLINEEIIYWMDAKRGLEFHVKRLSDASMARSQKLNSIAEMRFFLDEVQFPGQGVILIGNGQGKRDILKNLRNLCDLESAFVHLQDSGVEEILIETDLRAMFNPTRMVEIGKATEFFVSEFGQTCHRCGYPGFVVTEVLRGLPCALCGLPTQSVKEEKRTCRNCAYKELSPAPGGKDQEDPMYCSFCNP